MARVWQWSLILCCGVVCVLPQQVIAADKAVDFNLDVRPIIADKCFACHGPDAAHAKGNLRLDIPASAYEKKKSGDTAIVPGNLAASALAARIDSKFEDELMPPPESNKKLTAAEKATLKQWIAQGGAYAKPWAYVAPIAVTAPKVSNPKWPGNFIDPFILARLDAEKIAPSPLASKTSFIRRLTFDLTGLPPTLAEIDAFDRDTSRDAYEKLVDRLLASPHFGERMAIWWLDLVRFADTVGYHGDQTHRSWPYRDYVIDAFNANKRFDAFVREQLAGDLLEKPTREQFVATCYNRLLQTTHEGGAQLKEYRAIYMADRVRNVSQVFMGATVGCAQCHNHKYDPYTHRDFHTLGAFFADVDDEEHLVNQYAGLNSLPTRRLPELTLDTEESREQLRKLDAEFADAQKALKDQIAKERKENAAQKNNPIDKDKTDKPDKKTEKDAKAANKDSTQVAALKARINALNAQRKKTDDDQPRVMYTKALDKPRDVHILPRGNWLDESGEIVLPAVPAFLGTLDTGDHRATRLDLANWLVTPEAHGGVAGLSARVQVNRFWHLLMGTGIANVLDDFGGQGEPPMHPQLLDQLAIEFVKSGWDVKHMLKTIVMSSTYRQSSAWTDELRERDPQNRLYARQSARRLPAESVRDNALAIAGLLREDIGGPSVNPYQPAGYYNHLNFPARRYLPHNDERQWRRGVYVHWQRQFLHPMLKAFDAPTREECTAGRPESNTPTQALVLLNDPTFVEAARMLGALIVREGGNSDAARIVFAFRLATSRKPEAREIALLTQLLSNHRSHFKAHPSEAAKIQTTGLTPAPKDADVVELAAWTSVARTLLNLNESITRN